MSASAALPFRRRIIRNFFGLPFAAIPCALTLGRKMKKSIVAFVALSLFPGCNPAIDDSVGFRDSENGEGRSITLREQFDLLTNADPKLDAEAAFERGDYRFAGVIGIALFAPGVEKDPLTQLRVKTIQWTTDSFESEFHIEVNGLANRYARDYNRHLVYLFNQSSRH
jgi:hypothetical protein